MQGKQEEHSALVWGGSCGRKEEQTFFPGGSDCSDPSRRSPAIPIPCPLSCDHLKDPPVKTCQSVYSVQ